MSASNKIEKIMKIIKLFFFRIFDKLGFSVEKELIYDEFRDKSVYLDIFRDKLSVNMDLRAQLEV